MSQRNKQQLQSVALTDVLRNIKKFASDPGSIEGNGNLLALDMAHEAKVARCNPADHTLLHQLTPLVEQLSIDEAFLDVTDLPDSGESIARKLQANIRTQLKLPCSLGVATNKLVAKIANDVGKSRKRSATPPRRPA